MLRNWKRLWKQLPWVHRFWIVTGSLTTFIFLFLYLGENLRGSIAIRKAMQFAGENDLPMDIGVRLAKREAPSGQNFADYRRILDDFFSLNSLEEGFRGLHPHRENHLADSTSPWRNGVARELRLSVSPPSKSDIEAADHILTLIEPWQQEMARFEAASVAYSNDTGIDWTENVRDADWFGASSQYQLLGLRAYCLTAKGESGSAVKDLKAMCRIAGKMDERPLWFHVYGYREFANNLCENVWAALNQKAFSLEEIETLTEAINASGFRDFMVKAYINEEAFALRYAEQNYFSAASRSLYEPDFSPNYLPDSLFASFGWDDDLLGSAERLLYIGIPSGWFKLYQSEKLRDLIDIAKTSPSMLEMYHYCEKYEKRTTPYQYLWNGSGYPRRYREIAQSMLDATTDLELALTALKLEHHRLTAGQFPESLATWTPPPIDHWSGLPLKYLIQQDGTPMIYSVGPDQMDNGGTTGNKSGKGDLVWKYNSP